MTIYILTMLRFVILTLQFEPKLIKSEWMERIRDDRSRIPKYVGCNVMHMYMQGIGFYNINCITIYGANEVKNNSCYLN
jgi:hypothetical protein